MKTARSASFAVPEAQGSVIPVATERTPRAQVSIKQAVAKRAAIVVPVGSVGESQLAKLEERLSSSSSVPQTQRNALKLKGDARQHVYSHQPRTVTSCWELRSRQRPRSHSQPRTAQHAPEQQHAQSLVSNAHRPISRSAQSRSRPTSRQSHVHGQSVNPHMSAEAMEDWWTVTPDELASLQGAESQLLQFEQATQADGVMNAWASEITSRWQRQVAQSKARQADRALTWQASQAGSKGSRGSGSTAVPSLTHARELWARARKGVMQQVTEKAKIRARQAMEAADAVAEEERVAEQQYQRGEFIFRTSNSVKLATDLPPDLVERVRAAETGAAVQESSKKGISRHLPLSTQSISPRAQGMSPRALAASRLKKAARERERESQEAAAKPKYPNQWYVSSHMWGAGLQQKLKAKILAKSGAPDPDHLKYTEPDALEWAQGAEQQAAQMYKKYIRQSGMRVPHYLRTVKTPELSEDAMLNSGRLSLRRSWPSSKSGTLDKSTLPGGGYNMQAMFANTGSSGKGQDGNKDHMAVVAAAMQAAKPANDGAATRSQAVTTATIRGILTGIK